MKKFFALLLSLTLLLSLAACGSNNDDKTPSSNAPSVTEPVTPEDGGYVTDGTEDGASTEDNAENLPAEDAMGDAENKPAADAPGDAKPSTDGATSTTKPSGTTNTPQPAGGTTNTTQPSGGTTTPKPQAPAPKPESPKPEAPAQKSLTDLMSSLLSGVDAPNSSTNTLTAEQFPAFLFIDQPSGAEAVSADAMIGSIAHSVVLMRLADGADVSGIADQVKSKADPRKWICVEAEKTVVKTNGNLVLLVMSDTATADAIAANFAALSV